MDETSNAASDLWGAFTGGLKDAIGNYGEALGERTDSFGNVKPAGSVDPARQYTQNPITGQLVNNQTGKPASIGAVTGLPSWALMAGIGVLLIGAVLLVRRR